MKFTFKKYARTGSYRSFQKKYSDIKLNKKKVGTISEIESGEYRISFAVKKEKTVKDPAPFKWVRINKSFRNENGAREYIKLHDEAIMKRLNLYQFDD